MNYKSYIQNALLTATLLVLELIESKISIKEFMNRYSDFYYYEALDGHEANEEQASALEELADAIEFHKLVQTEIVDKIYLSETELPKQYVDAGRISDDQAVVEIVKLVESTKIDEWINKLKV